MTIHLLTRARYMASSGDSHEIYFCLTGLFWSGKNISRRKKVKGKIILFENSMSKKNSF